MEMTPETQHPRKRCSRCHKLKLMGDYVSCITCRGKYYALKDKIMKMRTPSLTKKRRRCLIIDKMLKSLIRSITALPLK